MFAMRAHVLFPIKGFVLIAIRVFAQMETMEAVATCAIRETVQYVTKEFVVGETMVHVLMGTMVLVIMETMDIVMYVTKAHV